MKNITDVNQAVGIFKVLANKSNLWILKKILEKESYIIELEKSVGLDRGTIKRRLYVLTNLGLLKVSKRKTPKGGTAIYYSINEISIFSVRLVDLVQQIDVERVNEVTKVYE